MNDLGSVLLVHQDRARVDAKTPIVCAYYDIGGGSIVCSARGMPEEWFTEREPLIIDACSKQQIMTIDLPHNIIKFLLLNAEILKHRCMVGERFTYRNGMLTSSETENMRHDVLADVCDKQACSHPTTTMNGCKLRDLVKKYTVAGPLDLYGVYQLLHEPLIFDEERVRDLMANDWGTLKLRAEALVGYGGRQVPAVKVTNQENGTHDPDRAMAIGVYGFRNVARLWVGNREFPSEIFEKCCPLVPALISNREIRACSLDPKFPILCKIKWIVRAELLERSELIVGPKFSYMSGNIYLNAPGCFAS